METVSFSGKEYTKASTVAKRFRYTSDYIGQLCRAQKVDARLVGRSWYVNIDSLQEHRKEKYKKPEGRDLQDKPRILNNYASRVEVEPILNKKVVKVLRNTEQGILEVPVRYEPDEYALIPRVEKNPVFKPLPVLPAEAEHVPVVKDEGKSLRFRPEPLPVIQLKGALKVAEYEGPVPAEDDPSDPEVVVQPEPDTVEKVPEKLEKQRHIGRSELKVKVRLARGGVGGEAVVRKVLNREAPSHPQALDTKATHIVAIRKPLALHGVPPRVVPAPTQSVIKSQQSPVVKRPAEALVVKKLPKASSPQPRYSGILLALFLALACSVFLVGAEAEVVASESKFTTKLVVQVANVWALFER